MHQSDAEHRIHKKTYTELLILGGIELAVREESGLVVLRAVLSLNEQNSQYML